MSKEEPKEAAATATKEEEKP